MTINIGKINVVGSSETAVDGVFLFGLVDQNGFVRDYHEISIEALVRVLASRGAARDLFDKHNRRK